MSLASKITFGLTCASAAGAFIFINYSQQLERQALRQGPIKDAARIQAKMDREMTKKQLANDLEHKEQMELREKSTNVCVLGDTRRWESRIEIKYGFSMYYDAQSCLFYELNPLHVYHQFIDLTLASIDAPKRFVKGLEKIFDRERICNQISIGPRYYIETLIHVR
ncbi:uncharacterized protein RJT20DRAFT_138963 [Scheffersomyces xylosifermentans]|uniref:uncharacterized protein n=1 Tax=Scheffersomyces xylosifermentans TaxID=1304137 RepID=UPI00315D4C7A